MRGFYVHIYAHVNEISLIKDEMRILWLLKNELYFFKSLQGQINFGVPYTHLQRESR